MWCPQFQCEVFGIFSSFFLSLFLCRFFILFRVNCMYYSLSLHLWLAIFLLLLFWSPSDAVCVRERRGRKRKMIRVNQSLTWHFQFVLLCILQMVSQRVIHFPSHTSLQSVDSDHLCSWVNDEYSNVPMSALCLYQSCEFMDTTQVNTTSTDLPSG